MAQETTRLMPHDSDAEEGVLGSLLIDGEMINRLSLIPQHFYHERSQFIYEAMLECNQKRIAIDQITLAHQLDEDNKLEICGGAAYLSHLIAVTPTSLDCEHYAGIVLRTALFRAISEAGRSIYKLGMAADGEISEIVGQAESLLLDIRKNGSPSPVITPTQRFGMAMERYEALNKRTEGIALSTGLLDFDKAVGGGLFGGELWILAARPGLGKTTLLSTIANYAGEHDKHVLFCSGEMTVESLTDRDVAGFLGETTHTIRRGGYGQELFDDIITKAVPEVTNRKVSFLHDVPITTAKVLQESLRLQLEGKLDLVVIDYLGLLDDNHGANQYERIGYISRKLKHMALKLNVPLLVAHQLNRQAEGRVDKRPQLADLRDSGRVEEDADGVALLYRDSYYQDEAPNVAELDLAKVRQGGKGVIRLAFNEEHQKYVGLSNH